MFREAEEDPLKQAPHQAVTSPSNLESPFRLYLIAPGSVFLLPARQQRAGGVLACWRAGVLACNTARMHAARVGACGRARVLTRARTP
jgi:hypothetical protein